MAAIVPTTYGEIPIRDNQSGTAANGLRMGYVRVTSTATTNTLALATYFPGATGIRAIQETLDGAQNGGTANTWSTTTLTMAGHAGSGVWDLIVWFY